MLRSASASPPIVSRSSTAGTGLEDVLFTLDAEVARLAAHRPTGTTASAAARDPFNRHERAPADAPGISAAVPSPTSAERVDARAPSPPVLVAILTSGDGDDVIRQVVVETDDGIAIVGIGDTVRSFVLDSVDAATAGWKTPGGLVVRQSLK